MPGNCGSGESTGTGIILSRDVTVTDGEGMVVICGGRGIGAKLNLQEAWQDNRYNKGPSVPPLCRFVPCGGRKWVLVDK
jgi:hypothetical protein